MRQKMLGSVQEEGVCSSTAACALQGKGPDSYMLHGMSGSRASSKHRNLISLANSWTSNMGINMFMSKNRQTLIISALA